MDVNSFEQKNVALGSYIEIRCPNQPYDESKENTTVDHSEVVCSSLLGGIPLSEIDLGQNKSVLFRCMSCKMCWLVEFGKFDGIPSFTHVSEKIPFTKIDDIFPVIDINGRKIKNKDKR